MKKNILLIGGSYGIGQEIANRLKDDHTVMVASRTNDGIPDGVRHFEFDVATDDLITLDLPETIDGFVYCPGSINLRPFKMLKPEAFQKEMEINFMGMVRCIHGILPKLSQADNPSVVLFSTVAVKVGMPFHTSIAAAKGAVEGFAKSLAAEYAPKLRVNVIAPSLTDTPLAGKLLSSEEKKEKMGERHPLKRVGTVEDIAATAVFLLKDDSSWMTGQIIGVDGGMSTLNVN
ncbi:SDR family oxidoreductase [Aureitalea sp. L0-47]|uniref:SDR family NAD(P)-dependent oxidoreductase n=1 Tax=Aureitalea sp. L0-47 TaxID=2816962 RepID=UPI0022374AD5|nr:SDR family oxidoreductase [Aureitalea sp. L0-47]MCW5520468.1 SDR family oxidoreductase [Aureitalea sp. L0-47]